MNLALWIVTGLLAAVLLVSSSKIFVPKEKIAGMGAATRWVEDFSPGALKAIGALELLAAAGLILPAVLDIAPGRLLIKIRFGFRADLGSPVWTRTKNLPVNSRLLCQLSYGGSLCGHGSLRRRARRLHKSTGRSEAPGRWVATTDRS